jgi:hypothetical protein
LSEQNLDFIDNLRKNQHIALFSDDEEKSFILQTRFLKNGLEKGEICAYLSYRDPDEIIRILTDNGLKTDHYIKNQKLTILHIKPPTKEESEEFFEKKIQSLFSDSFKPTTIIGEPLSDLDKEENMKIKIMLEKKLHEFVDNQFSILCPYNNCEIESGNKTKWLSHLFQNHDGAIFSPKETQGLSIYF